MHRHRVLALGSIMLTTALACGRPAPERPPAPERNADATAEKQRPLTPPAGSKLAAITQEMRENEVERILGKADAAYAHETGNRWNPYAFGRDNRRTVWAYKGVGRVVFTQTSAFTGQQLNVHHVEHDPAEDGRGK